MTVARAKRMIFEKFRKLRSHFFHIKNPLILNFTKSKEKASMSSQPRFSGSKVSLEEKHPVFLHSRFFHSFKKKFYRKMINLQFEALHFLFCPH